MNFGMIAKRLKGLESCHPRYHLRKSFFSIFEEISKLKYGKRINHANFGLHIAYLTTASAGYFLLDHDCKTDHLEAFYVESGQQYKISQS